MQDVPVWGEYANTLDLAGQNAVPRPVTVVWPDQSPAIAQQVNAVLAGQQSPEEGMSKLKGTLEQIESSA
jgi:ABC-type glycerol-3-phosphate transport system substrate-binding protein